MSKETIKKIELNQGLFWRDKVVLINVLILVVFLLAAWVLWIVFYRQTSIPVGMPSYFGFLQFNQGLYKYVLPLFGTVVAVLHLIISMIAYSKERMVSYLLIGGAAFLEVLILITVIYYMSFV